MTKHFKVISQLLVIIAANKLVIEKLHDWGNKDLFYVETDELLLLIKAGATITYINKDGGDGTLTHLIQFGEYQFMQSTTEIITI